MPITLRYIGTQNPWFESAVTGRPGKWTPGDTGDVADADVALLLATALFEVAGETALPFAFDVSGAIIGARRADGSVAALAPVSRGFRGYGTIAQRDALTELVAGDIYVTSDFGLSGGCDVMWRWDGTKWRPLNGRAEICARFNHTIAAPGNATEFKIAELDVPAGALLDGMGLHVLMSHSKSGTADTFEASLRMGATGAYADTSLITIAPVATNDYWGTEAFLARASATTVRRTGGGAVGSMDSLSSASTSAGPIATVANLDSAANKLVLWGKWTTGTAESTTMDYTVAVVG